MNMCERKSGHITLCLNFRVTFILQPAEQFIFFSPLTQTGYKTRDMESRHAYFVYPLLEC